MSQFIWPLRKSSGLPPTSAPAAACGIPPAGEGFPIIAVCHLSWDWVWQRPQQFLSRFARTHPVLFVETYCSDVAATRLDLQPVEGHPALIRALIHLPATQWHDGAFIDAERRRALQEALQGPLSGRFDNAVLWFNDPMAVVAFAGHLGECAIVYDCMDELSQFRGAPPELSKRERVLLRVADVVFCGGQKMRARRLPLNANCHFFGTGVDVAHFGTARAAATAVAPEVAAFGAQPVLGYFGVIDERIDYTLLAKLADARADWQIVMVGPHAKVDPAQFPRRPNLHWIGARPYAGLPALTKGFSACLMPFALNAATEYINPTKALEYMAAGRPVISTALDEVRSNFAGVAHVANSHEEFIAHCRREVARPTKSRIQAGLELAAHNTWEALVARMEHHIAEVLPPSSPVANTVGSRKAPRSSPAESPSPSLISVGTPAPSSAFGSF